MNGKSLTIAVMVVLVAVAGYILVNKSGNPDVSPTPKASSAGTPLLSVNPSLTPKTSATPLVSVVLGPVKTFTVTGKPFSFDPSQIKVKKGDMVKIIFKNTEGIHDWVIDEFNARTPKIQSGQTAEIQFVASKTGTFEYYCSVGTHRQQGMKGKLIVE